MKLKTMILLSSLLLAQTAVMPVSAFCNAPSSMEVQRRRHRADIKQQKQVFYLKTELSNFRLDWLGPLQAPAVHEYPAKGGKTTFRYGYFVGRQITGKAYVWTEHTVKKNSNGDVYEIYSTSHACKVDISKN